MICDDCSEQEECWMHNKFGKKITECTGFTAKEELIFETTYTNEFTRKSNTSNSNSLNRSCSTCTQPKNPKRPWECLGCSLSKYSSNYVENGVSRTTSYDGKIHYNRS